MYLLKLTMKEVYDKLEIFTFHHVSIKTLVSLLLFVQIHHSHSTMYLLKQFCIATSIRTVATFTFHHVSIKTYSALRIVV